MKWSVGAKIGAGFALALVLLCAIGVDSYLSTTRLIETADLVAHTNQVRFVLSEMLSLLKDAETGQRGYIVTGEESYLEPYTNGTERVQGKVQELRRLTADNPNQQRRLDALEPLITQKLAELKEAIDLRKNKGFDAARLVVVQNTGKAVMDNIRKVSDAMDQEESELLKVRDTESRANVRNMHLTILFGTIFAVVFVILAGFFITRNITVPLNEISNIAERIASGDLTVSVATGDRTDEVGSLVRTFDRMSQSLRGMAGLAEKIANRDLKVEIKPQSEKDLLGNAFATMVKNLQEAMREIREGTSVLASSASEILASTTQVASGAAETATAVSQTTSTVEEVKQTAQISGQKAKQVSESAQKSAQGSQTGRKAVNETIEGMNRIRKQVDSIAESIVRLSERSQAIGEIIATVSDLAEQSNLLAVNAAIEAAKAGEHGKGFAVVAQEVRSLAEQSKQATSQVRGILGDIQKATSAAVMATEQGSKAVEAGEKQAAEAGESIQILADSITEAAQAGTQIGASVQQQLVGMDQVASAMENIKQASAQNAASTRQAETAARNLHELGQRLKQLVGQYQV